MSFAPPPLREGGMAGRLGFYDRGRTPYFASRMEPRLCYCLYVPREYDGQGGEAFDLVVLVHGTARSAETYRNFFEDFAERERAIILAPLFPAGMSAPGELSSYKLMRDGDIAYDLVLLDMVAEVAERYRLRSDRFLLHGFSGGGHFAHRFLYIHPERLMGVSIGAPGIVTLLDPDHDFWVGVRNFEAIFGTALDIEAASSFLHDLLRHPRLRKGKLPAALVINRCKPNTQATRQALELLAGWPLPVVAQLRDSQAYVVLTGLGKSVFDYHSAQVREHQQDWTPLLHWLGEP